jgi:hypothetical protein
MLFQNQKRRHAQRVHVAEVIPPIGLDRAAASQHRHPVDVAQRAFQHLLGRFENFELGFDHPAGDVDALQIFAELGELPALIVRQGLVGQALETASSRS